MKLALAYKNFAANRHISHIGLGVAAMNTQKSLIRQGKPTLVWPIVDAADLRSRLEAHPDVTHVVVSAPWIPSAELQRLVTDHPGTRFAVNCHSNVGFLQADSNGVKLVREAMEIERSTPNFHLAGNSRKFCQWVQRAYMTPCTWLPNLYYLDQMTNPHRPVWTGGTLRMGAFGATRPLKNFMSAAGAALEIAQQLRCDTEIWLSAGRTEGGGEVVLRAATEMLRGLPNVKLVQNGWQTWAQFRTTVSHMHLLLQPSYTESFNMVTADGIAAGVPSVVSDAIDWAPRNWMAESDDVIEIARVGRQLLHDHLAPLEGLQALERHNEDGLRAWDTFMRRL
ncbi:MAG TPA: glycosyltransferase [Bryobacteraceae bacterium]|jgi:hypothetical protein|nr:glycosyltransferase [Bryobacteraceae bacterium]